MTAIATQLGNISSAIATHNANTTNDGSASVEDAIISLITQCKEDLVTLPLSDSTLSTTTVLATKSERISDALREMIRMCVSRGYMIG